MGSNGYEAERDQMLHDGREADEGCAELTKSLSEAEYNRLTAALAEQHDPWKKRHELETRETKGLEHALSVAEEVGIGPAPDDGGGLDPWEGKRAKDWRLTGLEWNAIGAKPRFGARLREWLSYSFLTPAEAPFCAALSAIADGIDQDAEEAQKALREVGGVRALGRLNAKLQGRLDDLRRQVEEAVERGRYGVHLGTAGHDKDVIDAEPFLDELGHIFRGREPVAELVTRFLRDVLELDPASPEAEDSIVVSVGDLEIIAERYIGGRS